MDEQRLPQHPPPEQREDRPCVKCGGHGEHVVDASYDELTGLLTQAIARCIECEGRGSRSVYLYGKGRP